MTRKGLTALCVIAACLVIASCKKLDSSAHPQLAGPLAFESMKFGDSIPDDYGTLVGVTQNSLTPAWVTLWFQRPDRSIKAVFVNIEQGRIYDKALTIARK